jgi:hypothetical protein
MITHYGLSWSERDVRWAGVKGSPAMLLGRVRNITGQRGRPLKTQASKETNFAHFVGVYCLYAGPELIYIGETGLDTKRSLFPRLKSHRSGSLSGRWDSFSWFGRDACSDKTMSNTKLALQQLEAISIAIINPGFNRQSGTFGGATQVYQCPHEEAAGDTDTRLDRIEYLLIEMSKKVSEKK